MNSEQGIQNTECMTFNYFLHHVIFILNKLNSKCNGLHGFAIFPFRSSDPATLKLFTPLLSPVRNNIRIYIRFHNGFP